jgi:hypothetical protein
VVLELPPPLSLPQHSTRTAATATLRREAKGGTVKNAPLGRRGGGNDGGLPRTDGGGEDVVRWWAQSIRLRFACSASLSQLSLLRLREH